MEWTNIYLAFGLTLFAGLVTAIGGGIAASVPVYYATGSMKKAFWWAVLWGLCPDDFNNKA